MANWLRLRRQSHAPREQDGTETIYAAADGTLMHMDPEGSETEFGAGVPGGDVPFVGTDPPDSPTDGELWWDPDDDTAPGGGSQPYRGPYTFAFDDANLDTPRDLFDVAPDDLVILVPRFITPFDDGNEAIADAQLYVKVGDTQLKPATIVNRLQIEADIATLHDAGDAWVQNTDTADVPFFPTSNAGPSYVASVKNACTVTAWVADGNGDPIAPTPTQGLIDLFFLVYTPTV